MARQEAASEIIENRLGRHAEGRGGALDRIAAVRPPQWVGVDAVDFYVSVARRSRFWLSRACRSRAIEVDIAIWAIDLAIIGCSG